jgi:hypothetical protein
MGLKIEDNCYVHNLLFSDDQVIINRGEEDANYIGRKLEEECEKCGFKIHYGKTKYLGTDHSDQQEYNCKCKTVLVFRINSSREMAHLTLKLKKGLVKQEKLLAC